MTLSGDVRWTTAKILSLAIIRFPSLPMITGCLSKYSFKAMFLEKYTKFDWKMSIEEAHKYNNMAPENFFLQK